MTPQRLCDLAFSIILLIVLAPLVLALALIVLLRDGRPVFFGSERMTAPGRPFTLWKFRTMVRSDKDSGVSGGDKRSRITASGRWLRPSRLDELPQLWNILRGDMGFVGPRPPLRQYVEKFPDLYAKVLKSRPGVTGLATLTYHATEARLLARTSTAEETDAVYSRRCVPRKARLDLIYQRNRSLCLDAKLVARTALGLINLHPGRKRL